MRLMASIVLALLIVFGAHVRAQQPGKPSTVNTKAGASSKSTSRAPKPGIFAKPTVKGARNVKVTEDPLGAVTPQGYIAEGCLLATEEWELPTFAGERFAIQASADSRCSNPPGWTHAAGINFYGPEGYGDPQGNYVNGIIDSNLRLGALIASVSTVGLYGDHYDMHDSILGPKPYRPALYVGRGRVDT